MHASKNWCDGERVKKLGIWRWSKQGLSMYSYNTIWKIEIMHSYYPKESAMHYSAWLGTDIPNADNMGTDNAASTDSIPYKKDSSRQNEFLVFLLNLSALLFSERTVFFSHNQSASAAELQRAEQSFSSDCFRKVCQPRGPKKNIGRQQKPRTGET